LDLRDSSSTIEIKTLENKKFTKGKVVKLESIFDVTSKNDLYSSDFIGHNIKSFKSYTFCSKEVIEIFRYDTLECFYIKMVSFNLISN